MKRSFSALTPAALVAMAFPVLFLLVPDGLPFVYAVCGGGAGTATNPTVQFCRSCADNDPLENDSITVSSCSVSGSYNYCALTGQVTLSIATIDACDVEWTATAAIKEVSVRAIRPLHSAGRLRTRPYPIRFTAMVMVKSSLSNSRGKQTVSVLRQMEIHECLAVPPRVTARGDGE